MNLPGLPRQLVRSMPTIVFGLCIAALAFFEVWRSHDATRDTAEKGVQSLVHALSEQTARTFQSIDLTLENLATHIAENPTLPENDAEFRSDMQRKLSALPYVRAMFVIGPDGFITHDTDYPFTPHVSLADRPYFKTHQLNHSLGLHIGQPLKSRSVGVWFISVSRRIDRSGGGFGGAVVAAVEPLYFESFYRPLLVGDGTITLLLTDGMLIARSPNNEEAMGKSYISERLFQEFLPRSSRGFYWTASPIDAVRRVVGYQALTNIPVVMLVTMSEQDAMAPWRTHSSVVAIGSAILLFMLIVVEGLSRWYRHREEAVRTRLEQAERLEAIGRFAGGVAHDFGNIIRIIRSALLLLKPMTTATPNAAGIIEETERALANGLGLVTRLLSQARNEKLRPEPSNLDKLVEGILPILKQAAGPKCQIIPKMSGSETLCLIAVPEFEAAILNLVLNARDAMPNGGAIRINVQLVRPSSGNAGEPGVEVTIKDEGEGMRERVRYHATDPFFTTKPPGAGHGMGLAQVQDFAKRSGAHLTISSGERNGTIVRLRFPTYDVTQLVASQAAKRDIDGQHQGR